MAIGLGTDTAVVMGVMALSGVITGWLGYRIRYHAPISGIGREPLAIEGPKSYQSDAVRLRE